MKPVAWLGSSLKDLQAFPYPARRELGYQLERVQAGLQPSDFKSMPSIGAGVEEIRVWVESETHRMIYIARLAEAVYVLHAFPKKTQQASPKDIALARARLAELLQARK